MTIESVHHDPDGIHVDSHPDANVQEYLAGLQAQEADRLKRFVDAWDHTPDVTAAEYADELEATHAYFAGRDLPTTPTKVFDPENYRAVIETLGDGPRPYAFYLNGRATICSVPGPGFDERFNLKDVVLGMMLHEGAHGTMVDNGYLLVSALRASPEDPEVMDRHSRHVLRSGFRKYKVEADGTIKSQGSSLEEAFADLERTRALQEMGREPKLDGLSGNDPAKDTQVIGVGGQATSGPEAGTIVLPAAFAFAAQVHEDGTAHASLAAANYAAYALHLLNMRVPGLFEQMEKARRDPASFREVIRMINSIQPDLYRNLRELQDSEEELRAGLRLVQNTLYWH